MFIQVVIERLKNEGSICVDILPSSMHIDNKDDSAFDITNTETWKVVKKSILLVKQNIKINNTESNDSDEEFDFDDI